VKPAVTPSTVFRKCPTPIRLSVRPAVSRGSSASWLRRRSDLPAVGGTRPISRRTVTRSATLPSRRRVVQNRKRRRRQRLRRRLPRPRRH